ncbi:Dyp-type peroxidase [Nocardioides sp. KR10-350]|uniref:Dyp-type peroxidase n=1 Tax=Nocardioides cheoyonin TaxID=3156615 RepID=UPI0032B572FB
MTPLDRAQDVLAPPAKAAIFLTVTVRKGHEDDVRDALADVPGLIRAVGFRVPELRLSCVVGLGAEIWDRLYDEPRPTGLHPFRPLVGARHTAVATPGDLLFHIRADRPDLCFELARQLMLRFAGAVDSVDEVHGFRYWDERDLLGFVDGTESPTSPVAAVDAALIGDEKDPYYGASFVIVQKYLHDLTAWDALPVEQQELVIGRKKLSDVELPDSVKPSNSHVVANTIVGPDGEERQIVRDNMPFGTVGTGQLGTFFIAYAADPAVTEEMLQNMFLGQPPGNHDRILDFSIAVTGCLFFVPPADFLEDPEPFFDAATRAGAPVSGHDSETTGSDEATSADGPDPIPDDSLGSLGIGSLKSSSQRRNPS